MRVNDILAELERQVVRWSARRKKARIYLKKKEELKTFDVNMFLLKWSVLTDSYRKSKKTIRLRIVIIRKQKESYEQIKTEYEKLEQDMAAEDEKINAIRDEMSQSAVTKEQAGEPD